MSPDLTESTLVNRIDVARRKLDASHDLLNTALANGDYQLAAVQAAVVEKRASQLELYWHHLHTTRMLAEIVEKVDASCPLEMS